jgi:hypothetical protein
MKKICLYILLSVSFLSFSQKRTSHPDDLIFEYEGDESFLENTFDGILNYDLHRKIVASEKLNLTQTWDTENCYSPELRNGAANMEDTLWLCVGDTLSKEFRIPFDGYMTSHYGPRKGRNHNGVDISLRTGDIVNAAWSGRVRYAKFNKGGYGNLVIIRHYNGLETYYAHLSKLLVVPNQEVKAGDVIGLGGNTGRSYGAHLHFEIRFYDAPINPEYIIDFANKNVRDENFLVYKDVFKNNFQFEIDEEEDDDHNHEISGVEMLAGSALSSNLETKSKPAPVREFRKYHKVRSGDNLFKIANANGTTVEKLCELNGIRKSSTLRVGVSLRVR